MSIFPLIKSRYPVLCMIGWSIAVSTSHSAEWKAEPGLNLSALYNDNVRMYPEGAGKVNSTGYTVSPRIMFSVEEDLRWYASLDAQGKVTRYQDIENADSDNVFFNLNTGRRTELTDWRMGASYSRNTNFDTDYDTQNPDSGFLLDDHTERETRTLSPSVRWSTSEVTQVGLSLTHTEVTYDEITNLNYKDYKLDSAQVNANWSLNESHQIGFTGSYAENDSPDANFSYNLAILQLDYIYTINEVSQFNLSVGQRSIESLAEDALIGCSGLTFFQATNGVCPDTISLGFFTIPVTEVRQDIRGKDEGAVVNFAYSYKTEPSSHKFSLGRTVIPSSFGSAQEEYRATYIFNVKNTQRFTTNLILEAIETKSIHDINRVNDKRYYRFEPSIAYRMSKSWTISSSYRHLNNELTEFDIKSKSNAVYINLSLNWPKLASTY